MAHFVFIHGVYESRSPKAYAGASKRRRTALARYCFKDTGFTYYDPHWAKYGAPHRDSYETIPAAQSARAVENLQSDVDDTQSLIALAQEDFSGFLGALTLRLSEDDPTDEDLALVDAILAYDLAHMSTTGELSTPDEIANVATDEALMATVIDMLEPYGPESFRAQKSGRFWEYLKRIAREFGKLLRRGGRNTVVGIARNLTPHVAVFLGDAFVYFADQDKRRDIRRLVIAQIIDAATAAKTDGQPLILCGHSMGANILVDLLWDKGVVDFIEGKLGHPLKIDLLYSVGTQLGLMEEWGIFANDAAIKPRQKPATVHAWWHMYDPHDVLAFRADPVISGVMEYSESIGQSVILTHGYYFVTPLFLGRLRQRLSRAGLLR